MNRYTKHSIEKLSPIESARIIIAALELQERSSRKYLQRSDRPWELDPLPLLKCVIRKNRTTLIDIGKGVDKLELMRAKCFSGTFCFSKKHGGYVPQFLSRIMTRWMCEVYNSSLSGRVSKQWDKAKAYLASSDGMEPMLIDSYNDKHVYFLKGCETGLIKIGISDFPEIRRQQVQGLVKERCILIHIVSSGGRKLEKELHNKFSLLRTNHPNKITQTEWFEPGDDLLEFLGEK